MTDNIPVSDAAGFAVRFDVSRETLARLTTYQALLGKWQKAINLVGPATLERFWDRHAADSAQIMALAPAGARFWLDLGSGAGFPGLVLAILLAEHNPEAHVHMIESDRKKVNFLRTVLRDTNVTATVHHARIEAVAADTPAAMAQIDVVTARALATLDDLAALMAPLINPSTIALLHKGRDWQDELTACQKNWNMIVETHASCPDEAARIVEISQLERQRDANQPAAF